MNKFIILYTILENCFNENMFQKYNDYEWNYQNSDGWDDKLCTEGINQSPVNLPRIGKL